MKLRIVMAILALIMMASPGIAAQKDPDTFTHTLTGCLRQGANANIFALTDENGKSWELRSKTVRLGSHLNHTVTVTGKISQHSKGTGDGSSGGTAPESRLLVTSLKMVNDSCNQ